MKRRDFIKISSLATGSCMVPGFLKAFDGMPLTADGKILVVIQLSGGNDWLNTVIPYRNDLYYKNRPGIGIALSDALALTDDYGLNPEMGGLKEIYDQGWLTLLHGVGYPNPNRSHFRSMDIWHSASDADTIVSTGWLGRYLDSQCIEGQPLSTAIEIDDSLTLAMKGELYKALALQNPEKLYKAIKNLNIAEAATVPGNENLDFIYKTFAETSSGAEYIYNQSRIYKTTAEYPSHKLGQHLKMISELIISGAHTRVYYCELGGFDTHVAQKGKQGNLLKQYSDAVKTFVYDLQANNRFNDVAILTFSEFGRRVQQNASSGTDHGAAGNAFLISGALSTPGFYNTLPDLSDLDEGDLKYSVDFRNIYATLLDNWLSVSSTDILKAEFSALELLKIP